MNVYTNNRFEGHYPVGTAAVVVAETPEKAAEALNNRLADMGLPRSAEPGDMVFLSTTFESATILNDGNY